MSKSWQIDSKVLHSKVAPAGPPTFLHDVASQMSPPKRLTCLPYIVQTVRAQKIVAAPSNSCSISELFLPDKEMQRNTALCTAIMPSALDPHTLPRSTLKFCLFLSHVNCQTSIVFFVMRTDGRPGRMAVKSTRLQCSK